MEKQIHNTNYFANKLGEIITYNWKGTGKRAILKPAKDNKGYLKVGIIFLGKLKSYRVHRLIAETFIPNPENKPQVNHINGIKSDNRVENLEWCTNSENQLHAIENGLIIHKKGYKRDCFWLKGSNNVTSILTETQVLEIRQKFKPRIVTRAILSKQYNVSEATIKDIVNNKTWKHLK